MTLRVIGSILLMLLAAYIVIMNWGCVIVSKRNKSKGIDKYHSTVPFVSFILASFAFVLYPFTPKGWIGIIPLVDISNWMLLIGLPWVIVRGVFRKES